MRSLLLLALAVLLGLTGAGCAGMGGSNSKNSGPKPMSRAEFARAANNACARAHRAVKRIPKPTNYATALHSVQRAIPVLEHEIIALRRLTPPRSDSALFAHALGNRDAQDVAAHRLVDAIEARQASRVKGQGRQVERLVRRLRRLDRRLGLPACVKAD